MPEPTTTQPITLKHLTLRLVVVPHRTPFRSAIGHRRARQALFVRWTDQDGAWGIGECACRPDPYFNGEFVAGALAVIRDFIFPHLPRSGSVQDVATALSTVRSWPFTTAAVLDAAFDLLRRKGGIDPLDHAPSRSRVPVGLSLPIFETPEAAVERVEAAVAAGYQRVKLKVTPRMPLAPLDAVRTAFPTLYLGFDANGACGEADGPFLTALAGFRPDVLEQPFAPDRLDLCVALKQNHPTMNLCLDESVSGLGNLIVAHRLGALDELNLKPGRVGGLLATVAIMQYCTLHQIPAWVGGMFETGVGRAALLRVAARLPTARAHDLSPPHSYLTADVVQHPLAMDAEGHLPFDDTPVVLDETTMDEHTTQRLVLTKP